MAAGNNGLLGPQSYQDPNYGYTKKRDQVHEAGYAELDDHNPTRGRQLLEFRRGLTKRKKKVK